MNKGGLTGGVLGSSAGSGPTAAAAAAAAQKQKTLVQRVEGDIANIVDNFSHLVNVARVCLITFCIFIVSAFFMLIKSPLHHILVISDDLDM